ncbi:DEAD/DEAH box helicase [Radiobacillus deserti]|uniref:Serine/threonine protein phosphatase n=1 Tax=Radiobacillus deserti TaxID=2594883 RepID=A0A516KIM8_9BACI|nr:DEAD/DEAH box helicase [Radiobacillus deserti]QDP41257.1 serine/threonine protein phosphatase [Radiobacillus deserti]
MRSYFLDKQDIVRITGDRFYKRGYDYFQKGRVFGLHYNPSINSWRGQVRGTETYSVRVFFFEHDDLEASCDCPAYATHYTCKHIAAVLLAISHESAQKVMNHPPKDDEQPILYKNDSFSTRLIDALNATHIEAKEKHPLSIAYQLASKQHPYNSKLLLEVQLSIGENKLYQVKNIREFLQAYRNKQAYKLTQSFTYNADKHSFDEQDQALIRDLLLSYDNESLFSTNYATEPVLDKRSLFLSPSITETFLTRLATRPLTFKASTEEEYDQIKITNQGAALSFKLDSDQNDIFYLDISNIAKYQYFESYGLLFSNGTFFRLNEEQKVIMNQIYSLLPYRTSFAHPISKENVSTFLTNVVPKLEKVGTVAYTAKMQERITVAPLQAKVYIDEVDQAVSARVEFHYGGKVALPYQDDYSLETVIKRNHSKELEVLLLMEEAGFVYLNNQFHLFKQEAIYDFLKSSLQTLQEKADVFLSSSVEAMISDREHTLSTSVQMNPTSGMLDIHFDILGISKTDIDYVLQALVEKKRYYRLPNGPLLSLEEDTFESFREFAERLQLSKQQIKQGALQVPAARSFQVEDAFGQDKAAYSESFQTLLEQLKHPNLLSFSLPKDLHAELRDYQKTGFQWFKTLAHYHLGGILADDMGLGKTVQTIAFLLSEKEAASHPIKNLIVTPASLLYNWKKEIEKFAPSFSVRIVAGSKEQRRKLLEEEMNADIYITSYPTLRKDIAYYQEKHFDSMILDEAQAIKNHLTQTAKAVRAVSATKRFALSGTPIENALEELWSIFQAISPGLFGHKKAFLQLKPDYVAKITRPFILRRVKKEVLHELPDKIESVQYSDLTKEQKEIYLAYLERIQQEIAQTVSEKGFNRGKLEILAGLTRLRQICCHPSLFLEQYEGQSGKLEQLEKLVLELKENGKRPLIFSQFSSMLKIIYERLNTSGIEAFYLDGSTPSQQRVDMVDTFNTGEKDVFLISLKAGGTGLNLTGADTVILYDLWWNPAIEEQAAGRAHRIGQKNVVQVIRLITEGTIEEKIYELQQKKRELVDQIIQPGETMLSKLTEEEIRELLEVKV